VSTRTPVIVLALTAAALLSSDCGGSPAAAGTGSPGDGATGDEGGLGDDGGGAADDASPDAGAATTFNVFDAIPMFGMYVNTDPNYTPPPGVLMWTHGTEFVVKVSAQQQADIGADLAARITYIAQCDNYDRLGNVFFVREPPGQAPQSTDPRTELVRFITPFSDYERGAQATHVYPDADLSAYAHVLADPTMDVWIGVAGGSNPYSGDPCVAADAAADFAAVGFKYSLDFVSSKPLDPGGATTVVTAIGDVQETTLPITAAFAGATAPLTGHVTVIVSGHGSAAGGDEYESTKDTLTVGGTQLGQFDTQIDCAPFAKFSPDGNPGIFQNNLSGNPRNWCPGALVPSHTFPATLAPGSNTVQLDVSPSQLPSGSYYATSITFTSP
jgi:hypothetical protein